MQPYPFTKRDWIYGGISHPPGVIVARPIARSRKRLRVGSKLALVGDEHVAGLAPFVRQLASDARIGLAVDVEPGTCFERWYKPGRLARALAGKPDVVLVSLGVCSPTAPLMPMLRSLAAEVRADGGSLLWLRPPDAGPATKSLRVLLRALAIPSFHSEVIDVHRSVGGKPSARGYAGWAGAVWRWLA